MYFSFLFFCDFSDLVGDGDQFLWSAQSGQGCLYGQHAILTEGRFDALWVRTLGQEEFSVVLSVDGLGVTLLFVLSVHLGTEETRFRQVGEKRFRVGWIKKGFLRLGIGLPKSILRVICSILRVICQSRFGSRTFPTKILQSTHLFRMNIRSQTVT